MKAQKEKGLRDFVFDDEWFAKPGVHLVVGGPMVGKTANAIFAAQKALEANKHVEFFCLDVVERRILDSVQCLDTPEMKKCIAIRQKGSLEDIENIVKSESVDVVVVDGLEFAKGWTEDSYGVVEKLDGLCRKLNKAVFITYRSSRAPYWLDLLELQGVDCSVIRKEELTEKVETLDGANSPVIVRFKKVHPDAKLPTYAHDGDVGMDVYAVEDTFLNHGEVVVVRTGLVAEIPYGYEIQVRPRSGLAVKGITIVNAPGSVDCGYRNEIGVILCYAFRNPTAGLASGGFQIHKGDRIAQFVLAPVTRCKPILAEEIDENTERGKGGFGSTGV